MKIVAIGGSGLIGKRLLSKLREAGHDAVGVSPSTGARDPRRISTDVHARYFGTELNDRSLRPSGDHPRIAPTHFEHWLARSPAEGGRR